MNLSPIHTCSHILATDSRLSIIPGANIGCIQRELHSEPDLFPSRDRFMS